VTMHGVPMDWIMLLLRLAYHCYWLTIEYALHAVKQVKSVAALANDCYDEMLARSL